MAKRSRKTSRKARGLHGTVAQHSADFDRESERAEHAIKMANSLMREERCQAASNFMFDAERRLFSAAASNEYGSHKSMTKLFDAISDAEEKFKKVCVR